MGIKKYSRKQLAQRRKGESEHASNSIQGEKEKERARTNGQKAAETRCARERRCRTRRTRGVRPELDRIGELVITETGDSLGTSAGLPRAST